MPTITSIKFPLRPRIWPITSMAPVNHLYNDFLNFILIKASKAGTKGKNSIQNCMGGTSAIKSPRFSNRRTLIISSN